MTGVSESPCKLAQRRGTARCAYLASEFNSTPPTLIVNLYGNGEMPVEFVIGGTIARPSSDAVCLRMVERAWTSVSTKFVVPWSNLMCRLTLQAVHAVTANDAG